MNCIVCKEPMIILEHDQVEIDHCLSCGGIWLDSGELELLLGQQEDVHRLLQSLFDTAEISGSRRKCPLCKKKMEQLTVGQQHDLILDRCVQAHGLWFDRGELSEVIRILDQNESTRVAGFLRDLFEK